MNHFFNTSCFLLKGIIAASRGVNVLLDKQDIVFNRYLCILLTHNWGSAKYGAMGLICDIDRFSTNLNSWVS